MNQIFNNSTNPLLEHLQKHEIQRKQNSFIWYCIAFGLGFIICYAVMKSQIPTRTKVEES